MQNNSEITCSNQLIFFLKDLLIQLDFSSLYPHIMMMANLFGRIKNGTNGWHGGKLFTVEGYYDDKEMGDVGKLLRKLYYLRMFYKRKGVLEDGTIFKFKDIEKYKGKNYYHVPETNGVFDLELLEVTDKVIEEFLELDKLGIDRREYTIKILVNLIFGLLENEYYDLVYDHVAAGDCTRLGRQFIKYARKVFREAGYKLVYSDTDSWYFIDVFNDKQKYLDLMRKVVEDIKSSMPFPQITFDADIDDIIKYMFFFKGKNKEDKDSDKEMDEDDFINKPLGLMKKNYVYVTTDGKIKVKNLGLEKKSLSAISKKIFWDYMGPFIKNEGKIKFSKIELENAMRKYLQEDITLALMRKSVKPIEAYSESTTSMHAQISKKYGPGIHFMIPNIRGIGVGKGVKYCTYEEFKKYKMGLSDIDYNNFWKELNYFIQKPKDYTLFDFD